MCIRDRLAPSRPAIGRWSLSRYFIIIWRVSQSTSVWYVFNVNVKFLTLPTSAPRACGKWGERLSVWFYNAKLANSVRCCKFFLIIFWDAGKRKEAEGREESGIQWRKNSGWGSWQNLNARGGGTSESYGGFKMPISKISETLLKLKNLTERGAVITENIIKFVRL